VAASKEGPVLVVPVSSVPLSPRGIAGLATPSTVMLRSGNSLGSGFFVDKDLVLTNAHPCRISPLRRRPRCRPQSHPLQ
jgi:hypothetical protein